MADHGNEVESGSAPAGAANNQGGETPAEETSDATTASIDAAAALHDMRKYFEGRIHELEAETRQLRQRLGESPIVTVNVPSAPTRLKTFTGHAPTGGNEIDYEEWDMQTEQLMRDCTAVDVDKRVKASLKGLAWEQVEGLNTAKDILTKMRAIFGPSQSADDLYEDFQRQKIQKKEKASAFLLRLWDKLRSINRVTNFSPEELQRKVYRTFIRGLGPSHQSLSLEVRTSFGIAGVASPVLSDVLRTVRQLEANNQQEAPSEAQSRVHHVPPQCSLSEADLELIISRVTERLQSSTPSCAPSIPASSQSDRLTSSPGHQSHPQRPKGPCYKCDKMGHFARECRSHQTSRGRGNGRRSQARGGQ